MIKFLNIQIYVYVRTHVMQSPSARYIIIRDRFRCILFALYYFRMKLGQNVEKRRFIECNLRNIRRNIAKILVVSTIYVYTKSITHQFILNWV